MAKSLKRKIIDFSREEEELLINLIKERSAIYDPKDENYKNGQYRSLQWIEISDIMNKSVEECKTRWRSLRDTYKKKKIKTNASGTTEKWEFFDMLAFIENSHGLNPVIITSVTSDDSSQNIELDEKQYVLPDNEDKDYSPYYHQNVILTAPKPEKSIPIRNKVIEELKTSREERNSILKALCTMKTEHPIEIFFKGIAQTVMSFPPNLAAQAKFRVCQVVSELEYKLHNINSPLHGSSGPFS